MRRLKLRAPHKAPSLMEILTWVLPEASQPMLRTLLNDGHISLDGRPEPDGAVAPQAGALIAVDAPRLDVPQPEAPEVLATGEGWRAVVKPVGGWEAPLGVPGAALTRWARGWGLTERLSPVLALDEDTAGVWLLAEGEAAHERLGAAASAGGLGWVVRALVPRLNPREGELRLKGRPVGRWETVGIKDDVSDLRVYVAPGARCLEVREALAELDAPVLGDARHGGVAVPGGLALWSVGVSAAGAGIEVQREPPEEGWWPHAPVYLPLEGNPTPKLKVSKATLKALEGGHPWILPDAEMGDIRRFRPGTLVRLEGPTGEKGPAALVEGSGAIAARAWGRKPAFDDLPARLGKVLSLRQALIERAEDPRGTDAFRLVHGEGDGLPGVYVDRIGPVVRLTVYSRAAEGYLRELRALVRAKLPRQALLELTHLRDVRAGGVPTARLVGPGAEGAPEPGQRVQVHEAGLRFLADPWSGPAVGFFPDQRENRARIAAQAKRGQRWLNLFCHTGAFTAVLLRAGAEVVSVDLSQAYLSWMEENLALNGLGAGHQAVKKDVRAWLERGTDRFDGIIIDPPTSAAAGKRFWSSRQGYAELVGLALARLNPDGLLLACRNDRQRKPPLPDLLTQVAAQANRGWRRMYTAGPGPDFPSLVGFPEGDPFEGVLAQGGEMQWEKKIAPPAKPTRKAPRRRR